MKYTVLLLYPDYLSDGTETYMAHVEADDSGEAIRAAQVEARHAQGDPSPVDDPTDFYPLLVTHGHLDDVTPEGW